MRSHLLFWSFDNVPERNKIDGVVRSMNGFTRRMSWLGPVVLAVTLAGFGGARAATGIRALDEPAIAVKAPATVALIAITKAGHRLVAVGEHGVIIYSDDNGVTWKQGSVPVTVTLTCVAFVSPLQGWAAGHYGVILHTDDGGVTWQEQLNGIQANQLTMAAAQADVAATNNSYNAQRAVRRANFFISDGPDKPFLTILATGPNDAMVFGAYRMVMKTTDGGRTWTDWSEHVGDKLSHNLYQVIQAGSDLWIAGEIGLVFRSTDGGNSFSEVTAPTDATMFGALPTGAGPAVDGGVLVFGIAGQAYRSTDGGKTWQSIAFATPANLIAGKVLKSGALVVVGGDGSVYRSDDHGQSFKLAAVEPMALYDLVQADDGALVLVGNYGVERIAGGTD
jgi:photosystem II stability/assembly factor-like uncharacterized protein